MNLLFDGIETRDDVVIIPHVEMDEAELDKLVGHPDDPGPPGLPGWISEKYLGGE